MADMSTKMWLVAVFTWICVLPIMIFTNSLTILIGCLLIGCATIAIAIGVSLNRVIKQIMGL